jgi:hypothetical protein
MGGGWVGQPRGGLSWNWYPYYNCTVDDSGCRQPGNANRLSVNKECNSLLSCEIGAAQMSSRASSDHTISTVDPTLVQTLKRVARERLHTEHRDLAPDCSRRFRGDTVTFFPVQVSLDHDLRHRETAVPL